MTGMDLPGAAGDLEALEELVELPWPRVAVSCESGEGLEELGPATFRALDIMRIYTKEPRKEPDMTRPFTLERGSTVADLARGIHKEIAARVMAVNLTRILMIAASKKHDRAPTRLSFTAALCAITTTSLKMSVAPAWQLPILYELMLGTIARSIVPDRPGRAEPRAVAREEKHYPRLKGSRAEWRRRNAAA